MGILYSYSTAAAPRDGGKRMNTDKSDKSRRRGPEYWAAAAVCAAAGALAVWLLFRCLIGAVLPFLLACLLSMVIRPLTDRLTARSKHRGPAAALLVLLFAGLSALVIAVMVRRGITELEQLLVRLGDASGDAPEGGEALTASVTRALDWVYSASEHLPFLRRFEQSPGFEAFCTWLDSAVRTAVEGMVTRISKALSEGALLAVKGLPTALLFTVVFLLSCYYLAADDGHIGAAVAARLPAGIRDRLPVWRENGTRFFRRYLRAYLLICLVTFSEMLVGLFCLHKPYPLLFALLIAFVDLLPVFGTGTVLIPWAVIDFVMGDVPAGLGLLVLYGVSLLVRQIIEPRLVGDSLGIHPLLSLVAVYAGFRLFGLAGMILSPLAAAAVKAALSGKRTDTSPPAV